MQVTAERFDLSPPLQGRWSTPLGLALVAHALLIAALTWGVGWQTDAPQAVFEAELWSQLPQQAAPRAVPPPPAPTPPKPAAPAPKPEPVVKPAPPPPKASGPSDADIATAQAKKKAEADEKARAEQAQKDKLAKEQEAKKAEAKKKAAAEKAAADKQRKLEAEQQAKEAADEKNREQLRKEQMARMMGQAGATGAPQSTGTAQRSSGPSPGYAGRIAARIKANVVFTEPITGNPRAEVEVRTLPDGSIASRRIVKSSGSPAWDEAVLRAIDRTATLPRDTDGSIPDPMVIGLRPQD